MSDLDPRVSELEKLTGHINGKVLSLDRHVGNLQADVHERKTDADTLMRETRDLAAKLYDQSNQTHGGVFTLSQIVEKLNKSLTDRMEKLEKSQSVQNTTLMRLVKMALTQPAQQPKRPTRKRSKRRRK